MSTEMLVAIGALALSAVALVGSALVYRRGRRDHAHLRALSRRLSAVESGLIKQRERHRGFKKRVMAQRTKMAQRSDGVDRITRDAQRLSVDTARALEFVLMDVNAMRRDLDALGGDRP